MMSKFNKIIVIGAGTMGSGIAAHLANSNRQVVLLDLKGKDKPNQISENGTPKHTPTPIQIRSPNGK